MLFCREAERVEASMRELRHSEDEGVKGLLLPGLEKRAGELRQIAKNLTDAGEASIKTEGPVTISGLRAEKPGLSRYLAAEVAHVE